VNKVEGLEKSGNGWSGCISGVMLVSPDYGCSCGSKQETKQQPVIASINNCSGIIPNNNNNST
jgi:hypothetical protein